MNKINLKAKISPITVILPKLCLSLLPPCFMLLAARLGNILWIIWSLSGLSGSPTPVLHFWRSILCICIRFCINRLLGLAWIRFWKNLHKYQRVLLNGLIHQIYHLWKNLCMCIKFSLESIEELPSLFLHPKKSLNKYSQDPSLHPFRQICCF